jgi:hypothetical protein
VRPCSGRSCAGRRARAGRIPHARGPELKAAGRPIGPVVRTVSPAANESWSSGAFLGLFMRSGMGSVPDRQRETELRGLRASQNGHLTLSRAGFVPFLRILGTFSLARLRLVTRFLPTTRAAATSLVAVSGPTPRIPCNRCGPARITDATVVSPAASTAPNRTRPSVVSFSRAIGIDAS